MIINFSFLKSWKFWLAAGTAVLLLGVSFWINQNVVQTGTPFLYRDIDAVPAKQTALLLGAKVYPDGRMSDILTDRAATAVDLYRQKKVQEILVSGDHGRKDYDEVNTIKDYLLKNGIPKTDIFLDHAGFDTYDSVYRARAIFDVSSMIIVTQEFHLPRSLYIARSLGIDAVGMSSDRHEYVSEAVNEFREFFARIKAFIDVSVNAQPKFLGEKIPVTGDSSPSWDEG